MDQVAFGAFFNEELDFHVEGGFDKADVLLFYVLLQTQQAAGVEGDLCELGVHQGRSAIVLGKVKRPNERLFCLGAFDEPEAGVFRAHARRLMPESLATVVEIRVPEPMELAGPPPAMEGATLRFLHLDAGRGHREMLNDLRNFAPLAAGGGILALEGVFDPMSPGVASAMTAFCLSEAGQGFVPFATTPAKAYLCHRPFAPFFQRALVTSGAAGTLSLTDGLGGPVLVCFARAETGPSRDALLAAIG
ncbi:class I SAM-dependent methyltransferase [Arenibaculum pallidiluteum]|uniref:class I SAM-dependent methyltransferase n=1 Tax=Arenibaculum pallidiluteum TaxID=2812559 RepID=UPI001A972503|nr:class I SAM-dependent methyltransferase [Arenibaculum pallidiluteum]